MASKLCGGGGSYVHVCVEVCIHMKDSCVSVG